MSRQRLVRNARILGGLILIVALGVQGGLKAADAFQPVSFSQLPDFKEELETHVSKTGRVHVNGYISTVNAEQFNAERLDGGETIKLKRDQTGFKDDFKIRVKFHPGTAPLAVVMPGIFGKADDKFGKHWQAILYDAGCHVMCFDSLFRGDINKRTMLGVPGNLKVEAETVAKMISLILDSRLEKSGDVRSKVTTVRLYGTSYGGMLALNVIRTEAARQWPADRCLVISPPVKMLSTAGLVDQFRMVDLPKYDADLMKLLGGYTPKSELPTTPEECLVRAGIAYVFFNGLKNVVKESAKRYMPELKGQLEAEELGDPSRRQLSDWGKWTFDDFVSRMAAPFWKTTPEGLWSCGDVDYLLGEAPAFTQVVVAADDPLSRPEEIQALQQHFPEPRVLVLPHGGHQGYSGTRWLKSLLTQTFKP